MSRKTWLALLAILGLAGAFMIAPYVLAAERGATRSEAGPDEFAGKIVDIRTTTNKTFVLESVKVIQLGEQSFLSGRGISKYRGVWWEGVPVRVNISSVVSYCPMSPQQFEMATGKLDEGRKE